MDKFLNEQQISWLKCRPIHFFLTPQFMPQIYKVMKYAMQAPHAIETLDDFLASFGNSSLLQYHKKTPQPKHVTNPAIPMCQYAGNLRNTNTTMKLCHKKLSEMHVINQRANMM